MLALPLSVAIYIIYNNFVDSPCLHYRFQLLLLVALGWRFLVTTAGNINIEQLLLYVVLILICYHHHCCRHHKRPGKHHGPGSVQARLAAVALERWNSIHYNLHFKQYGYRITVFLLLLLLLRKPASHSLVPHQAICMTFRIKILHQMTCFNYISHCIAGEK